MEGPAPAQATPATDLLHRATAAARAAGAFLSGRFGQATTLHEVLRDLKLAEDQSAEAIIVERLRAGGREPILSEEAGWQGDSAVAGAGYWVVDPLDGSFNFAQGIPLCCVSIAFVRGRQPEVGVVYDFLRDELFAAAPAAGLLLNGDTIRRRDGRGILATGIPAMADGRLDTSPFAGARKVRMLGTAALSLAWVAAGRMHRYAEDGIRFWDVAAGLALVAAAGGSISCSGDVPEAPLRVAASGPDRPGQAWPASLTVGDAEAVQ